MAPEFSRRQEKISCGSPAPGDSPAAAADPGVLDLAHLARYTAGNRELEEELLKLFRSQIRAQVTYIAEATDRESWRFATHTLKGVARSIGAGAIADTAAQLEQLGHTGDSRELLTTLAAQIAECEREIERIIGR